VVERARPWYRVTNRVNAVVWALPVPRRLRAVLSRIVYQNPPMPRSNVLRILQALDGAGVEPVVMGGWGIDALVGEEQRLHRDLDLIVDHGSLSTVLARLHELGFEEWFRNPSPAPFVEHGIEGDVVVMRDGAMRVVDIHPMCLRELGSSAAKGTIGGRRVSCVSAKVQVKAHTGNRIRSRRERRRHEANLATAKRALAVTELSNSNRGSSSSGRALAQQHSDLA
jgi:lincosamide nucleotidyltransferase A/C/D/E